MALHLNLLHEEISQQRQRQRDPLKIGMMVLGALGAVMILYYMWNAYKTLEIRNRFSAIQQDWSKVEPKVTSAQKRSAELNSIISTTKVLDGMIDGRFYWAPFLEILSRCVAPNAAQITSVDGTILDDNKGVSVMIEGLAAGREPRAAAEELRQLLFEQLTQRYSPDRTVNPSYDAGFKAGRNSALVIGPEREELSKKWATEIATNHYNQKSWDDGFLAGTAAPDKTIKVEFKTLEDLDTLVKIGGANMAMARFALSATFNPSATTKAAPPPTTRAPKP